MLMSLRQKILFIRLGVLRIKKTSFPGFMFPTVVWHHFLLKIAFLHPYPDGDMICSGEQIEARI